MCRFGAAQREAVATGQREPGGEPPAKQHPGETAFTLTGEFDRIPAASMLHWLRADRPGQYRGIPEITPALPLFAQLRRYTLAVLAAAETAADFAAVLYTDAPANGEAADQTLDVPATLIPADIGSDAAQAAIARAQAVTARTPPTPNRISCRIRWS